jgi:hypothetical protein
VNTSGVGPKHQNQFSFRHNKNSSKTKKILEIPNYGLCHKCTEIIEWRKKYRKYKPLKGPKKCCGCSGKTVVFAYHVMCQGCAWEKKVCPKCLEEKQLVDKYGNFGERSDAFRKEDVDFVDRSLLRGMKERKRRALIRLLESGQVTPDEVMRALEGKLTLEDLEDDDEEDSKSAIDEESCVTDGFRAEDALQSLSDRGNEGEGETDDENDVEEEEVEEEEADYEEDELYSQSSDPERY